MTVDALKAIMTAQKMVAKTAPTAKEGQATEKRGVLPTARTRTALDMLANNTADTLAELRLDMKALTMDLFAWSGLPRFNKPLMHKINALVNDKVNYQHNIELIAFAVAASRMLDADRLTRLLDAKASTRFAPSRYTLQFAQKLEKVFGQYQPQRQEQLLISLWETAHNGRWWEIHVPVHEGGAGDGYTEDELVDAFVEATLDYNMANAEALNNVGPNQKIVEKLHSYTRELQKGVPVNPDFAVFSSHLTWLPTSIRPESPIVSVLTTYIELVELIEYKAPKAPENFPAMYPNVSLYSGERFPYHASVLNTQGRYGGLTFEVIPTAGALEENRNFMGNCTGGYLNRLLKGTTFLYRIQDAQGGHYNAAVSGTEGGKWSVGEINSRHNRGNVPANVRDTVHRIVGNLPKVTVDTDYKKIEEANEKVKEAMGSIKKKKYRFTV